MEKQIAAFDIGDKRIGVAFSDPFGEYAVPSDTYFRTGSFLADVKAVARIAQERQAGLIVCGLPVNADGTDSVQTEKTRRFVSALQRETEIPVVYEDERGRRGSICFKRAFPPKRISAKRRSIRSPRRISSKIIWQE